MSADLYQRLDALVMRVEVLAERINLAVEARLGDGDPDLELDLPRLERYGPPPRLPLPDDRPIIEAMLDVDAHKQPVRVKQIADAVWHGEQGHNDLIRLGQRLGMMSSVDLVVRAGRRGRYGAHSWGLPAKVA